MAIVRQIPKLYLRGSLTHLTMANLTTDEQNHVASIVDTVVNHSEMQRHKGKFLKKLGDTIAADYSDDKLAAEEEFQIAVWRAVVNLYYHRKYTFKCKSCKSGYYITKRGKRKNIDRKQTPCPNCLKIIITDTGDTDLKIGDFIDYKKFKNICNLNQNPPKCESSILAISGNKIYNNPDDVINNPRQLVKFFGEFVWNYFRQTLKENSRVEHKKVPQKIIGPADEIIIEELISLCSRLKLDYDYCSKTQPEHGFYSIRIIGLQTPPEFSAEFVILRERARLHDIEIIIDDTHIHVVVNIDAPNIEAYVIKPEHVLVVDNYSSETKSEDGNNFTISQISYRTIGLEQVQTENHVSKTDNEEVMLAIRNALPSGDCRKVFDIWAGQGDVYFEFSGKFGDNRACINHIAKFLGITTRAVNQHKEMIKVNCLANDFTLASVM